MNEKPFLVSDLAPDKSSNSIFQADDSLIPVRFWTSGSPFAQKNVGKNLAASAIATSVDTSGEYGDLDRYWPNLTGEQAASPLPLDESKLLEEEDAYNDENGSDLVGDDGAFDSSFAEQNEHGELLHHHEALTIGGVGGAGSDEDDEDFESYDGGAGDDEDERPEQASLPNSNANDVSFDSEKLGLPGNYHHEEREGNDDDYENDNNDENADDDEEEEEEEGGNGDDNGDEDDEYLPSYKKETSSNDDEDENLASYLGLIGGANGENVFHADGGSSLSQDMLRKSMAMSPHVKSANDRFRESDDDDDDNDETEDSRKLTRSQNTHKSRGNNAIENSNRVLQREKGSNDILGIMAEYNEVYAALQSPRREKERDRGAAAPGNSGKGYGGRGARLNNQTVQHDDNENDTADFLAAGAEGKPMVSQKANKASVSGQPKKRKSKKNRKNGQARGQVGKRVVLASEWKEGGGDDEEEKGYYVINGDAYYGDRDADERRTMVDGGEDRGARGGAGAEKKQRSEVEQRHRQYLAEVAQKRKEEDEELEKLARKADLKRKKFKEALLEKAMRSRAVVGAGDSKAGFEDEDNDVDDDTDAAVKSKSKRRQGVQGVLRVQTFTTENEVDDEMQQTQRSKEDQEKFEAVAAIRRKFKEQHKQMLAALESKNKDKFDEMVRDLR